jgi:hypothetical protein
MAKASDVKSFKIADKLYLVRHEIPASAGTAAPVEIPTDHVMIYDCSGSMSMDLPRMREQIKKKLPKMLKEADTFSAIWFSGRGQCGVLLEKEPVSTLKDLQMVEKAVDRWLKPVGLTGFKEPLEQAMGLAEKLGGKGRSVSLTFMSDGCDNQWPRGDILKVMTALGPKVAATTIVEYGYYADRALLAAMAEKAGGVHIFAEDFDRYEPIFASAMAKHPMGGKRVEVSLKGDTIGGFAFALSDGDLMTFSVGGGMASVPEGLKEVYYLSPSVIGGAGDDIVHASAVKTMTSALSAAYAAVSLFAVRMKPDVVLPLLKALGDVKLIEQFAGCFGKQKYSAFTEDTLGIAFAKAPAWANGWDPTRVPREDAFTVMHVLEFVQVDPKARLLLDHPEFKYSKISRGRVDTSANMSEVETAELQALVAALSAEKDPVKVRDLNAKISALAEGAGQTLKFTAGPHPDGYPILKLTFNEERPNISILTVKEGTVDLSKRLKDAPKALSGGTVIPAMFPTKIFRNYAIIKDGLVNIDKLPLRVSLVTKERLEKEGVVASSANVTADTADVVIDLKKLPIINRQMVKNVSAKAFFLKQFDLVEAQAAQKVFNSYAKELLPTKLAAEFVVKYGEDGAKWLKEQGLDGTNGYAPPHTQQVEAKDFYMGKVLEVSLAKFSSLPSLKDVKAAMAKGKLTPSASLMAPHVTRVEAFLTSDVYTKAAAKEKVLLAWLEGEKKAAVEKARKLIYEIAQTSFAIIVGQIWPAEFASLEDTKMDITTSGQVISCEMTLKEIEIKI